MGIGPYARRRSCCSSGPVLAFQGYRPTPGRAHQKLPRRWARRGWEDLFRRSGEKKNRIFCGFHGALRQVLRGAGGVHGQLHIGHGVQAHHGAAAPRILGGVDGCQLEGGGSGEVHTEEDLPSFQAFYQGVEGRFQFASLHAQSKVQEVHRLRDPDDHFQIGADPLRIAAMADDHDFCHNLMRRNRWRSPVPSGRQPEPGWPASAS